MKPVPYLVGFIFLLYLGNLAAYEKFVLIVPLYNEQHLRRVKEYITCLHKNLNHPDIDTIHVVYDTSGSKARQRIHAYLTQHNIPISYKHGRQTFGDLFNVARTEYPNRNVIISNADIYFNNTLKLLANVNFENIFIALTRCDVGERENLHLRMYNNKPCKASMDTWIFRSPIRNFEIENIPMGTIWCEAQIAYQAYNAGLALFNPCWSIQACHLHASNIRNIKGQKPVMMSNRHFIDACTIEELIDIDNKNEAH